MANHDALLVAFQEYTNDIREAKRNQWRSVYYALLLLAGLVAYFQLLDQSHVGAVERFGVWGAYAGSVVFIAWYIWNAQFKMERARKRVQRIRGRIGGEFQHVLGVPREDRIFPLFFSFVIWIGAAFLFWFVFRCEDIRCENIGLSKWLIGMGALILLGPLQICTKRFAERR